MNDYTIYCTNEQTKKALELGAKIDYHYPNEGEIVYLNPTVEQMIGWLEDQRFEFYTYKPIDTWIVDVSSDDFFTTTKECATRRESTLAAIDAALDYLINKKGEK